MKTKMLLLVSAVALLFSSAVISLPSPAPTRSPINLNNVFDLIKNLNQSIFKDVLHYFFVDDVSSLAKGPHGCRLTFFCKAHEILVKHHHELGKKLQESSKNHTEPGKNITLMMRNLKAYTEDKNANCAKLLKNVTSNGVTIQIYTFFFEHLISCIQRKNYH